MYQFETTKSIKDDNVFARIQKDDDAKSKIFVKFDEYNRKHAKTTELLKKFPVDEYDKELKKYKKADRARMMVMLKTAFLNGYNDNDSDDENEETQELIKRVIEDSKTCTEMTTEDGKFTICPMDKFQLFYLVGACGSGKSYMASEIAQNYKQLHPKNDVYVISSLKEDETLDKLKFLKRIDVNTFLDEKPIIDEFSDSLVIFDDYENLPKQLYLLTVELINSIASTGRHFRINMICIQHNFTNYKATRLLLNEMTHCIVYPSSASNYALKYLLGTYCGLDRKQLAEIKKVKSRWVCIYKHHPNFMITEHDIKFLNN